MSLKRSFVSAGVPKPVYCLVVQALDLTKGMDAPGKGVLARGEVFLVGKADALQVLRTVHGLDVNTRLKDTSVIWSFSSFVYFATPMAPPMPFLHLH